MTGESMLDMELLGDVAHRLDLREPNRQAIESVLLRTSDHYDVQRKPGPFEAIVNSATGVGKTYVIAGLIDYLALADPPAKNFLIIAPGRTIRDKTIRNFTPGDKKSLTASMRSRPHLVTAENFNSPATRALMEDPAKTKVYVFTVQALTSKTGDGRETHEFVEGLGGSFYDWLAELDDLVVLADEHHAYRSPGFSRTIKHLNPELVVGLTATPAQADEHLVVYRYPLAAAIADELVKTPVIVGRRDARTDDATKLLDGVSLLRKKELVAHRYCTDNNLDPVNPVMLVIAQNIDEAEEFRDILDSHSFDGGAWVGKTLLVHSGLTGDEKEDALAALEAVEDPDSEVRIILNVGMLKEGWDVKNVYVIASMRTSASGVLTEQTLGRGLRLPFGAYTGIEFLDTLEVLAHERYEELLQKRDALNQNFIDYYTYVETRRRDDGTTEVVTETTSVETEVVPKVGPSTDENAPAADPERPEPNVVLSPGTIQELDQRHRDIEVDIPDEKELLLAEYAPMDEREPIVVPRLTSAQRAAAVSLNDIDDEHYIRFDRLGRALATDFPTEMRRTKIKATRRGERKVEVSTAETQDTIEASAAFDIPLAASRDRLIDAVMSVQGVQQRPLELNRAAMIADRVIKAMGSEAETTLSAFGDMCVQRLAREVSGLLRDVTTDQVRFDDDIDPVPLNKVRKATKVKREDHPDGGFDKHTAFNGWRANLYTHAWFDTHPEYRAAIAIDDDPSVVVWARLHIDDVPITWNAEGRRYNPDFVVIEKNAGDGGRTGWLVETKQDREMTSEEVQAKRAGARRWARAANASGKTPDVEWRYLLLSEQDVLDAHGLWSRMKALGT